MTGAAPAAAVAARLDPREEKLLLTYSDGRFFHIVPFVDVSKAFEPLMFTEISYLLRLLMLQLVQISSW